MTDTPASPAAHRLATPSWLDTRLVLGVLLVLVSVVVGARLLASADRSTDVWLVTRDLAPGNTLGGDDLERGSVRLVSAKDRYVTVANGSPVGYVLNRGVGRGELLPYASLAKPQDQGPLRDVSVPVKTGHLPDDLSAGQVVDVFVTPTPEQVAATTTAETQRAATEARPARAVPSGTQRLLASITVRGRPERSGAQAEQSVVLSVRQADALLLVSAAQGGGLDLVRVPRVDEGLTGVPGPAPAPTAP